MARPGAVGRLIAAARHGQHPRWSQAFLAEELTRRGFPVTRNQIARLEFSAPNRHNPLVLAFAAGVQCASGAIHPSAPAHSAGASSNMRPTNLVIHRMYFSALHPYFVIRNS